MPQSRPVALITGVGRKVGIGAGIASRLAADGWDVGLNYWQPYDDRMPWASETGAVQAIEAALHELGARTAAVPGDLERTQTPGEIFDAVESRLGPVTALVMAHCESVDSDIRTTSVESFDRHLAVNARATWLLVREFANRYRGADDAGRIVAITSDHVAGNLPYGASKGAMDRVVLAAARELADLRITANVINPGAIDTGWMTPEQREHSLQINPRGRLGRPADTAALVSFLCSADGDWINGQLLYSDGGWTS